MIRALFLAVLLLARLAPASAAEIEVFSRPGCPRCEEAFVFLEELRERRADVGVVVHDVRSDPQARARLEELAAREGIAPPGVPAFLVGGRLIVGFAGAETTGRDLEALLSGSETSGARAEDAVCAPGEPVPCPEPVDPRADETVSVPFLGRVDPRALGLPLFTIVLGLVDGFNPCAMWVLLFVLSLLVNVHDRGRMILVGATFVVVSGIAYFAFMAAWLNVFLLIGMARTVEIGLGALAAVVGLLNVKDFVAFGRGPSLAIPAAARQGLYARVRRVLRADSLFAAVTGIAAVALLVNVVELACTAGIPVVYTRILTLRELPSWSYYGYLGLYNLAYVADDAAMLGLAVTTLARHKLQERAGRWLKLVSGAVMIALAALLLSGSEWLARP